MNTQRKAYIHNILIALMAASGALACANASANDGVEDDINAAIQSDPDNAIRTMKAGATARDRRIVAGIEQLEPETRALVNGDAPEANVLRERGADARHRRQHPQRMEALNRIEAQHPPRPGAAAEAERNLARHPDEMQRTYRAGEATRERRHHGGHHAGHHTGHHANHPAGHQNGHHAGHADADAPRARTGRTRAAVAVGASGVGGTVAAAAGGWAVETAIGVHMPDEMEAAKWLGDTMQRPQDMHKRVGELAAGGVQMAGQFATSLTRPDRMAENVVNGGVGLVKTGAYMVTHPKYAVTTAGNTVVAVGNTAVGVGTGLAKGTYAVGKAGVNAIAHPEKTLHSVGKGVTKAGKSAVKSINKAGCGIGKLFKPSSRC